MLKVEEQQKIELKKAFNETGALKLDMVTVAEKVQA
jgi:hypothetical protein